MIALLQRFEREPVTRLVREVLVAYRDRLEQGDAAPSFTAVVERIVEESERRWNPSRPVINATGVVLHTNLGRSPLSQDAIAAMREAAAFSDLEFDLTSGGRGSRQQRVCWLLQALTGAESAFVTVNNAAAVLLALRALCRGREVVVSRGEAVEIGGGVRIPVMLRESGARLVEVGTTNRTRRQDYEDAIGPRTAAILRVHSSNFRVIGFTENVSTEELARLARCHGLPLIVDNGSGSLLDTATFGLAHEPMPQEALSAGAQLVAFSGDKLLGGPQAGVLLGESDLISRISSHPLARVVRPDKVMLAGLAATLLAYLRGDAVRTLPVWQMIAQSPDQLRARAFSWVARARDRGIVATPIAGESTIGGGSLPGETLPTTLIRLPAEVTAAKLRAATPAVIAVTRRGRTLLDLRTVTTAEEDLILRAVERIVTAKNSVIDSTAE